MAYKLISVKCPDCGQTLSIEENRTQAFCTYCGAKVLISNENEYVFRQVDEADIKKAETERIIRLREMELAEKNAPRLGSEERQLIVAYAEAVGDTDKVIGLINRLCEQGYELQKGQMDSFVKSEIESEIAVANAQRQIAQNPAAEPVVTILWSESPHLKDGQQMPLHEAEAVFKELDSARRHEREQPDYTGHWYDKTKFRIDFTMQGQPVP